MENSSTFHTDVDRGLFDKLPLESQSSSLSSLVTLPLQASRQIPMVSFTEWETMRKTPFLWTGSRLRISKAKSSPTRSLSIRLPPWK